MGFGLPVTTAVGWVLSTTVKMAVTRFGGGQTAEGSDGEAGDGEGGLAQVKFGQLI